MQDGRGVDGGWREAAGLGGAPLAAMTSLAALPLDLAALPLPLRLLELGMAMGFRLLEAMVPAASPGPVSK